MSKIKSSKGFTILEVLVSLTISSFLLTGLVLEFANVTKFSRDLEIKGEVRENLRSLFEIISSDIRNAGAGMPLGQVNFTYLNTGIGSYALPVLATSNNTKLNIRLSEQGKSTFTTGIFNSTLMTKELSLLSTSGYKVGDVIYLNEMTSGGTGGMAAKVDSVVNASILTLKDIILPTGVTSVRSGSAASVVSDVSIAYEASTSSVVRTTPQGTITLAPNSSVDFSYLDSTGAAISTLSSATIANNLAVIRVNIEVSSDRMLSSGSIYSENKALNIALRNLLVNR